MIVKRVVVGLLLTGLLVQFCDNSSTGPDDQGSLTKPIVNKIAFNDVQNVLGEDYALCIMNPDGSELTKIGPGMQCINQFNWAYDASRIVYENSNELSSVSIEGHETVGDYSQINYVKLENMENVTLDVYGVSPVFSHDHKKIAYYLCSKRNQYILLMVYDLTDNEKSVIIKIEASDIYDIGWSDDDKQLVYKKIQAYESDEYLCSVDLNDKNEQILEVTDLEKTPQARVDISDFERDENADSETVSIILGNMSPDNHKGVAGIKTTDRITFQSSLKVFLYDLDKKTEKLITTDTRFYPGAISWSPDSEKFVYFVVAQGFVAYDLGPGTSSTALEVTEGIPVNMYVCWSPN